MSKTNLKRRLGLFETTVIGIGIIVGAGIYVLLGKAAGVTGPSVWLSFIIAAILAAFTGLSYAELTSMYPRDSSEYLYVKKAFKSEPLAFLTGWICILTGILAPAAVALGFAGYFNFIFGTPILLVAFLIVVILSIINYMGIEKSALTDSILTIAAVTGLLVIVGIGVKHFGSVDYTVTINGVKGLLKSASLVFFAYIGFQHIVRLSEETKEPEKTLPKAIIICLVVSTLLYIGVSLSSVSILSIEKLSASAAPLSEVAAAGLGGNPSLIIAVLAIFATLSTILALLITTSRMIFGMAEEHSLPDSLSSINPVTKTPGAAVFLTAIGALFFVLFKNLESLASMVDFTIFLTFILVNGALIWLRYHKPDAERPFKTPLNIGKFPILPAIAIVFSLVMIFQFSLKILLLASVLVVLGIVAYELVSKEKTGDTGYIDPYRSACLVVSLGLFMIGAFILTGGFLVGQFWWTGLLWIALGVALFWYTYSVIFRE